MSRRIAAVFGVDQYAMPDNDLRYAVADAEAMAAALSSPPYDFEVHKFLDEEASRRNILRTLTLLRESPRGPRCFLLCWARSDDGDRDLLGDRRRAVRRRRGRTERSCKST